MDMGSLVGGGVAGGRAELFSAYSLFSSVGNQRSATSSPQKCHRGQEISTGAPGRFQEETKKPKRGNKGED